MLKYLEREGVTVQAGEDKAIEIIFDAIGRLKREAGVSTWWTGHTKRKSQTDVVTGEEYETLTSNMMAKYFNAIKTKLHVLGVASIDRDISKVKKKQKIGEDKVIGKVVSENRIITFRDDNFNIDSKSRFSEIVDRIPLDSDEFIKALEDAITKTFEKQGGKASDIKKEAKKQEKEKVEKVTKQKEEDEDAINVTYNTKAFEKIKEFSLNEDSDEDVKVKISELFTSTGKKASNVDSIPTRIYKEAVALIEEA